MREKMRLQKWRRGESVLMPYDLTQKERKGISGACLMLRLADSSEVVTNIIDALQNETAMK